MAPVASVPCQQILVVSLDLLASPDFGMVVCPATSTLWWVNRSIDFQFVQIILIVRTRFMLFWLGALSLCLLTLRFLISFKSGSVNLSTTVFVFKAVLTILSTVHFYINLTICQMLEFWLGLPWICKSVWR